MPDLRLLPLLFLFMAPALLMAQEPRQPVRLELDFEPENSQIEVIALPDSSLLIHSRKTDSWLRNPAYALTKYDARLEQVWRSELELKPEYDLVRYFTEAPYTYLIFQAAKPQQYIFMRVNLANGEIHQTEYVLDKAEAIHEFKVLQGRYFIIASNLYDRKPVLLYLDPNAPKTVMLPSVYGDESTFSDLLVDPVQGRADVVLTESNGRISRLQVKSFDTNGKLLSNQFILQQEKRSLLNAEITPGDTLSRLLIGTYGVRDLRYAQGFFTIPVSSQDEPGEFYPFLQLQHFFKYMKPRREARSRKREYTRVAEGKDPVNRYRLLLHDLITTPAGFVLAAEVYYPQYRNNSAYFPQRGIDRAALGYKRSHVVALGFDRNGILLWDNTFPVPDIVTAELVHAVEIASLPDGRLVMAYPENGKIFYRIMAQNNYTSEATSFELLPYEREEKISSTDQPGLIRWYGQHFVAFGYQYIRSPKASNRWVFYINKITF